MAVSLGVAGPARIGPRGLHRHREFGPASVNLPGQVPRDRSPPSIQTGPPLLHRPREVGPVSANPPGQIRRDRHPRLTRIGPRPLSRHREVGPATVNPPGQVCRDQHSPSTQIAGNRISETLDSVIPRSATLRFPIHDPLPAPVTSGVHDFAADIDLTQVQIPSIEDPHSVEMIFRFSQIYLAWRWIWEVSACAA